MLVAMRATAVRGRFSASGPHVIRTYRPIFAAVVVELEFEPARRPRRRELAFSEWRVMSGTTWASAVLPIDGFDATRRLSRPGFGSFSRRRARISGRLRRAPLYPAARSAGRGKIEASRAHVFSCNRFPPLTGPAGTGDRVAERTDIALAVGRRWCGRHRRLTSG